MNLMTIGTSWITESFISSAKTVPGITLCAVYSRNEEKANAFAKKHGAEKYYSDLQKAADDPAIDSVYIASPNRLHYEQSKLFIEHHKNVICEKPAASSAEQMRELYALAEKKGVIYTEAIMSIHTPAFSVLKELTGSIGKVRTVNLNFCQLSSKYPAYINGMNPNIFNPELHTGCLMDIGVYNIYLAAALFGKPEKILSAADFLESGADSSGSALLKYKDFTVTLIYSKVGQNYAPSEIIGDKGTVSVESVSQLTGIRLTTKTDEKQIVPGAITRDEIMSGEISYFLKMCENADYTDHDYVFSKETAFTVREITDEIRRQNGFPF